MENDERISLLAAGEEMMGKVGETRGKVRRSLLRGSTTLFWSLVQDENCPQAIREIARRRLIRLLLTYSYDYSVIKELISSAPVLEETSEAAIELGLLEAECCFRYGEVTRAMSIIERLNSRASRAHRLALSYLSLYFNGSVDPENEDSLKAVPDESLNQIGKLYLGMHWEGSKLGKEAGLLKLTEKLASDAGIDADGTDFAEADWQSSSPTESCVWDHEFQIQWPSERFTAKSLEIVRTLYSYASGESKVGFDKSDFDSHVVLTFFSALLYHIQGNISQRDATACRMHELTSGPLYQYYLAVVAHDNGDFSAALEMYKKASYATDLRVNALIGQYCITHDPLLLIELKKNTSSTSLSRKAIEIIESLISDHLISDLQGLTAILPAPLNSLLKLQQARNSHHLNLNSRLSEAREAHSRLGSNWHGYSSLVLTDLADS